MRALTINTPNQGLAEENFAGAGVANQSQRGKVHGLVGRLHVDVDAFEMGPHCGSRIGQSAGGERIGGKEVAEVVWSKRKWNRKGGKNSEAE